jgi:DNA-binding MarR family transcriptional regulator
MTETTTMQPPIVTIGQAVGQAEAVLSRLLARVLAQTGTSRQSYLAMQRLTALGGTATREDYVADLSGWLQVDLWTAGELASSLEAAGHVKQAGDMVSFTPAGLALRDQIAASGSAATRALLSPLDPADVEVTIRTLQEVTARGRALVA